jgi:hypothetical protein
MAITSKRNLTDLNQPVSIDALVLLIPHRTFAIDSFARHPKPARRFRSVAVAFFQNTQYVLALDRL